MSKTFGYPRLVLQTHYIRVRNCAFLVANATKNFALVTRISHLVTSGRLTISGLAWSFKQTTTLIFSQIYSNLIQRNLPIGQLLFTFPLLLKHKTNFPVFINLPQCFTAMKLRAPRFPQHTYTGRFRELEWEILHSCCDLVQATWWSVNCLVHPRGKNFRLAHI